MTVLTVANLKGGVGKSTTVINVAHALSKRFCETLVIDLDPQGDTSRLLGATDVATVQEVPGSELRQDPSSDLMSKFVKKCTSSIITSRPSLSVLPMGELCRSFDNLSLLSLAEHEGLLSALIEQFSFQYDYLVIDTPPTWSAIHHEALSSSSLLLVPVDQSEMSVRAAVRFLNKAVSDYPLSALLVRTMINRRANRIANRSYKKMTSEFTPTRSLEEVASKRFPKRVGLKGVDAENISIFLSENSISRSEYVHMLTYAQKTVFEHKALSQLQHEYAELAKDVEHLLGEVSEDAEESGFNLVENFA